MKTIIANWKMNLSVPESLKFIAGINAFKNEIVLAAPFTFLSAMKNSLKGKKIGLAGQNVSQFEAGAYTGEVSAAMLKEVGCSYCLVGHSERRIYFQEKDLAINKKISQLLKVGIKPVLCLGENQAERNKNLTNLILKKQLTLALKGVKGARKILVAYEPVWAISTFQKGKIKKAAKLEDIVAVHFYIKKMLKSLLGNEAQKIKILYGGTVNPQNSHQILNLPVVGGALVGGASLKISSLNAIIKSI